MKKMLSVSMIVSSAIAGVAALNVSAGEGISGKVYSDYYYFNKSHDANYTGQRGLNIRRVYFTYGKKLENGWSSKFRLEMNQAGLDKAESHMYPAVKDLYLAKKFGNHKFIFGISSTPAFSFAESHWGYRAVEKSPLDLYKFRSSRDTGIAFKGKFGSMVKYHLMFGNNSSNKQETDKYKMYALAVTASPMKSLDIQLYVDKADSFDNKTDKRATQVFLAWTGEKTKVGVLYSKLKSSGYDATVMSVHTSYKICKKTAVFARYDRVDYGQTSPSTSSAFKSQSTYLPISDKATTFSTVIAGYDYKAASNLHIIPNVEMVKYDAAEVTDNQDLVTRVTMYYKF